MIMFRTSASTQQQRKRTAGTFQAIPGLSYRATAVSTLTFGSSSEGLSWVFRRWRSGRASRQSLLCCSWNRSWQGPKLPKRSSAMKTDLVCLVSPTTQASGTFPWIWLNQLCPLRSTPVKSRIGRLWCPWSAWWVHLPAVHRIAIRRVILPELPRRSK